MRYKLFILLLSFTNFTNAQQVAILHSGTKTAFRGLSVVSDRIIWVSGTEGTVGRSIDSGHTWKWMTVKGFEQADFRDIEAFDETSAVIMGIGDPAYILRTSDGGDSWKVVYENKTKGMFLDAMEFWNEHSGIVVGDPIDRRMFIARTFDGGIHWQDIPMENRPVADSGEACFAASGTNVRKLDNDEACFITGGARSRLFIRDKQINLPIIQGRETTGANSIALKNKKIMIVTGGDFNQPALTDQNCFTSTDGGINWKAALTPPHGYRSCVEYISKKKWVSCGLNGVDISIDEGMNWQWISKESFHVCRKAKNGKLVFLAGADGKIAMLTE